MVKYDLDMQIISNSLKPGMVTLVNKMVDLFWYYFWHYIMTTFIFLPSDICHTAVFPYYGNVWWSNVNTETIYHLKRLWKLIQDCGKLDLLWPDHAPGSCQWCSHGDVILTRLGQTRGNSILTIVTTVNMVQEIELLLNNTLYIFTLAYINTVYVNTVFSAIHVSRGSVCVPG